MIGDFSCPILACSHVNFSTLSEVYKHLETAHFKCPFQDCKDQFLNLNDVDAHLRLDHQDHQEDQQETPKTQEINENAEEEKSHRNNTFPLELLEMIFGNLSSLNNVHNCRNACTRWMAVIDKMYYDKGKLKDSVYLFKFFFIKIIVLFLIFFLFMYMQGKIMSIGNKDFVSKNIEIIDLLNQFKYKIWTEMTFKDKIESHVKVNSKVYMIGRQYTYTYELDSDGCTKSIGGFIPGVNQRRIRHSCAKMRFHGKTIIVAAGGVDINSPYNGLRSVEIVDVSSPDPRWKYGNRL